MTVMCHAQSQILPIDTKGDPIEGAYYKDINNDFSPYIGTWMGNVNGKVFKITLEKVKDYDDLYNFWRDRLFARYEMRDSNGNLLYSTYTTSVSDSKLASIGFLKNKTILRFLFLDNCLEGNVQLKFSNGSKTQIEWQYFSHGVTITNKDSTPCSDINEMPQDNFLLTKQ